uniref:DUF4116 domain-containing protein n=1 Tax=viral metagenome TaxID=1070528 RepID=A0A6C0BLW2_9ZZZZ
MEFISPFWDLLFFRCDLPEQARLMRVCSRIYRVGTTDSRMMHRLKIQHRRWQARALPDQTPEKCLVMCQKDGYWLRYVHYQTPEICQAAVTQDPHALKFVHEQFKTLSLCLQAVRQRGSVIDLVPRHLITYEMCRAVLHSMDSYKAFSYVPEVFRTPDLCLAAVKRSGECLSYIIPSKQSLRICKAAIKKSPAALRHVHPENLTEELCLYAVQLDYCALAYVPREKQTRQVCLAAIHQCGSALNYVYPERQTLEMCRSAIQKDPQNMLSVRIFDRIDPFNASSL